MLPAFPRILFTIPALILALLIIAASCDSAERADLPDNGAVKTGAEQLIEKELDELDGKRIGLVMNPTARIGDVHMLDTLMALELNITALFAPEHGFRGEAGAGEIIEDGVDQQSGLPVFSLYGTTRKPTPEMLEHVDLLIFDMQDVGARFYTYIATLGLVMEAAAEAQVPVWVLDRPNPLGGHYVSGWMLEEEFESFVGPYPIPVAHGLTMGEMALMIAGEEWMDFETAPELRVIEMDGWNRSMIWPDTGLEWVAPSPNLASFEQAFLYPGTVYFEGTTMSEGRGTQNPFLTMGDPSTRLSDQDLAILDNLSDQVRVEPVEFTPRSIPGMAVSPKHQDAVNRGIRVEIKGYDFDPVRVGLTFFQVLMSATPQAETNSFLYRLTGSRAIDGVLDGTDDPMEVNFGIDDFLETRKDYLLYE
jgi:uncharacterized protein YbbC (DUF1343 family)